MTLNNSNIPSFSETTGFNPANQTPILPGQAAQIIAALNPVSFTYAPSATPINYSPPPLDKQLSFGFASGSDQMALTLLGGGNIEAVSKAGYLPVLIRDYQGLKSKVKLFAQQVALHDSNSNVRSAAESLANSL